MRTAYAVIVNGSRVNSLGMYKSESAALKAAYKAPQKKQIHQGKRQCSCISNLISKVVTKYWNW